MNIELNISSKMIFDTIMSGLDSGVQGWAHVVRCWVPGRSSPAAESSIDLHVTCELWVLDTREQVTIRSSWREALRLMAERHPRKFAEIITGGADCTTGNVLIQLAAFGEVRYG